MSKSWQGDGYVPGAQWRECPVCGFDVLTTKMVERYDGVLVHPECNDVSSDTPNKGVNK